MVKPQISQSSNFAYDTDNICVLKLVQFCSYDDSLWYIFVSGAGAGGVSRPDDVTGPARRRQGEGKRDTR